MMNNYTKDNVTCVIWSLAAILFWVDHFVTSIFYIWRMKMSYSTIEGLAAGLFVYVMTTILLGGINWLFKLMPDDFI